MIVQSHLRRVAELLLVYVLLLGLCNATSASSVQSTRFLCYSCTFIQSIHDEHDHYQGLLGCADPFDDTDIERVKCDDGECGKVLMKTDDGYLLARNCLPNCKPDRDEDDGSFTECCYTGLCNTAAFSFSNMHCHLIFALITSLLASLVARGFQ